MHTFKLDTLTNRERRKLIIGSIIPRPIAFITSLSEQGVLNAAPFSYFNAVSSDPPLIAVSVNRKKGVMKDTARNILNKKSFVIHLVNEDNINQVNMASLDLPPSESEVEYTHLTRVKSTAIDVDGIKESKIRFECVLEKHIVLGDEATDHIIGRIVAMHIDESVYEDGKINAIKLGNLSRLAGMDYSTLGKIITKERPKR